MHLQVQPDVRIRPQPCNAQAAAAEAAKLCPHGIDVLINNAGGLRSGNGSAMGCDVQLAI